MKEIAELLSNPLVLKVLVGYWLFSAAVGALTTPKATSPEWYQFLFRFAHLFSGNLHRAAVVFHVPGVEDKPQPPV